MMEEMAERMEDMRRTLEQATTKVAQLEEQLTKAQTKSTTSLNSLRSTVTAMQGSLDSRMGALEQVVPISWSPIPDGTGTIFNGKLSAGDTKLDLTGYVQPGGWVSGYVHGSPNGDYSPSWRGSLSVRVLDESSSVIRQDGFSWVHHPWGSGEHGSASFAFNIQTDPNASSPAIWLHVSGSGSTQRGVMVILTGVGQLVSHDA